MNLKGCGRKWPWLKYIYWIEFYRQRLRKNTRNHSHNSGIKPEIWTQVIPHRKQKCQQLDRDIGFHLSCFEIFSRTFCSQTLQYEVLTAVNIVQLGRSTRCFTGTNPLLLPGLLLGSLSNRGSVTGTFLRNVDGFLPIFRSKALHLSLKFQAWLNLGPRKLSWHVPRNHRLIYIDVSEHFISGCYLGSLLGHKVKAHA
jgi:hypothetical protein